MVQFGDFLKNKNLSKRNTFLNQKILSENLLFFFFFYESQVMEQVKPFISFLTRKLDQRHRQSGSTIPE